MVMIDVGDPKIARERFCAIQALLTDRINAEESYLREVVFEGLGSYMQKSSISNDRVLQWKRDVARLDKMIDQLDEHRPIGPDGKHGDRHTLTCGCEDLPMQGEMVVAALKWVEGYIRLFSRLRKQYPKEEGYEIVSTYSDANGLATVRWDINKKDRWSHDEFDANHVETEPFRYVNWCNEHRRYEYFEDSRLNKIMGKDT